MSQARFPLPLLDRFFPPREAGKNGVDRSIGLKAYVEILARDVELLCNTRASIPLNPFEPRSPSASVNGSLLLSADAYSKGNALTIMEWGLPDWTGFSPHSAETASFLTLSVQNALSAFEPRLHGVSVRQAEETDAAELRSPSLAPSIEGLRLRVDGRLTAQPSVSISFLLHINDQETTASELCYEF